MKKEPLSDRELKIIQFICKEMTTAEISEKVKLSLKRTEQIRSEILSKTNSRNTVGIVKYAIKNKIFNLK